MSSISWLKRSSIADYALPILLLQRSFLCRSLPNELLPHTIRHLITLPDVVPSAAYPPRRSFKRLERFTKINLASIDRFRFVPRLSWETNHQLHSVLEGEQTLGGFRFGREVGKEVWERIQCCRCCSREEVDEKQ